MSSLTVSLGALAVVGCIALDQASSLRADIQDPPMLRQGPIRKLGRGVANMTSGPTEIFSSLEQTVDSDGSSAAVSYGLVRGLTRTLARFGVGVYEVVTFPFPTTRGTYAPVLRKPIPWVHGGYEEFPPELGFDSRFDYCRTRTGSTRMP
jgi:putative exosortase-associated protein (TIGR04073 family)